MNISLAARPSPSKAVVWGLLLAAPAALFLLANVLNELGVSLLYAPIETLTSGPQRQQIFNLVSPVVFLGGIAAALLVNFLAIARVGSAAGAAPLGEHADD